MILYHTFFSCERCTAGGRSFILDLWLDELRLHALKPLRAISLRVRVSGLIHEIGCGREISDPNVADGLGTTYSKPFVMPLTKMRFGGLSTRTAC